MKAHYTYSDYGGFEEIEEPEPEFIEQELEDTGDAPQDAADNVVVTSDLNGAPAQGKKSTVQKLADKKVPNDKRTCTPYMSKYERARVLGTRAQQIRCGHMALGCLQNANSLLVWVHQFSWTWKAKQIHCSLLSKN